MKKKIGIAVFLLVLLGAIWNWELINYGFIQLQGQIKLMQSAVPTDEALGLSSLSNEEKDKIRLIQEVRNWAQDELGLNVGENYSEFVQQDSTSTMWVVTAAYPFELKSYEWSYGPVGKMAYKGFFKRSLADDEQQRMNKLGFDTDIGIAGGWSTLGILNDPILSGMLKRDSASLVELIIHESTHATVFHFGETQWNENIATAVGRAGMEQYLSEVLNDTALLNAYKQRRAKRKRNQEFIHRQANWLNTQYEAWKKQDLTQEKRENNKREVMNKIKEEYLNYSNKTSWPATWKLNNTFFTDYLNYHASNDSLEYVIRNEFNGDIKLFIESIK